jgi:hypothetical protein
MIETILARTLQEVRATLLQVLALLTPEMKGLLAMVEEEDAKIKSRLYFTKKPLFEQKHIYFTFRFYI